MIKKLLLAVAIGCLCGGAVRAGEGNYLVGRSPAFGEAQMKEQLRALKNESGEPERLKAAKLFASRHRLSSLQVKAIAETLGGEQARLDFALDAYIHTVDPENYYEVYDAFRTFSKVMRLHDGIRDLRKPRPQYLPGTEAMRAVGETDMANVLQTLSREGIDSTRQNLARQIIGARSNFSARQILQILSIFSFESTKLELAKFSFEHVLDPENYFMINEAFSFSSSKDELSSYVESKRRAAAPH
jgi:hypothetical protein